MHDERVNYDYPKLHHRSFRPESGGVAAGDNKDNNDRTQFETDEMEGFNSFRRFYQRIADVMHDSDTDMGANLSNASYCLQF